MKKKHLSYEQILKLFSSGIHLCGYIRNPCQPKKTRIRGKCALDDKPCTYVLGQKTYECKKYKEYESRWRKELRENSGEKSLGNKLEN